MDLDGPTPAARRSPHFYVGSWTTAAVRRAVGRIERCGSSTPTSPRRRAPRSRCRIRCRWPPFNSDLPVHGGIARLHSSAGDDNKIDILSYRQRPMYRLAYRNFGTHESLVTNQSVDAAAGDRGHPLVRGAQTRRRAGVYQQGTYAPDLDGIHRWMGSIAMDQRRQHGPRLQRRRTRPMFPRHPVHRPARRRPARHDAPGRGRRSSTAPARRPARNRWGDYTSMNVDPVDDCTFWYVNQWVPSTSSTAGSFASAPSSSRPAPPGDCQAHRSISTPTANRICRGRTHPRARARCG